MKTPAYLLLLLLFSVSAFAQDNIYLTDGSKLEGKVNLVSEKTITYKKVDNLNGPDYELDKDDVLLVVYENGTHEVFSDKKKTNSSTSGFGRHYIAWQFTDLLTTNVTLTYEFFNKSGNLGFKLPLSFGFNSNAVHYPGNPEILGTPGRVFASALELNYYPTGQGKAKYFVGPSLGFGMNRYYDYQDWFIEGDTYASNEEITRSYRFTFLVNNGVMFQPTKHLSITTGLGLGMSSYFDGLDEQESYNGYNNDEVFTPAVTVNIGAGYRF